MKQHGNQQFISWKHKNTLEKSSAEYDLGRVVWNKIAAELSGIGSHTQEGMCMFSWTKALTFFAKQVIVVQIFWRVLHFQESC